MTGWLRRLFRRPMTIADYRRAGRHAPCEPTRAPQLRTGPRVDPYAGVVNGPQLVKRTAWARAQHHARWTPDTGDAA